MNLLRSSLSKHPEEPDTIRIWFTYDPEDARTQFILDNIRKIPGRRYEHKLRCWAIPGHYLEEALSILYQCCDEVDAGTIET